jgi:hypothetical protein
MSAEQTFFNEGNVIVTNARFIAHGQTFAMAQVSSVRAASDPWFRLSWALPIAAGGGLLLLGGLMLLIAVANHGNVGCGLVTAMPGAVAFILGVFAFLNREYYVVVATSGGDVNALRSKDMNLISRVVTAVNSALVYRG